MTGTDETEREWLQTHIDTIDEALDHAEGGARSDWAGREMLALRDRRNGGSAAVHTTRYKALAFVAAWSDAMLRERRADLVRQLHGLVDSDGDTA